MPKVYRKTDGIAHDLIAVRKGYALQPGEIEAPHNATIESLSDPGAIDALHASWKRPTVEDVIDALVKEDVLKRNDIEVKIRGAADR